MGLYGSGWKRAMSSHFLASPADRKPGGEFQAIFQSLLNAFNYNGIFFFQGKLYNLKSVCTILFFGCSLVCACVLSFFHFPLSISFSHKR